MDESSVNPLLFFSLQSALNLHDLIDVLFTDFVISCPISKTFQWVG